MYGTPSRSWYEMMESTKPSANPNPISIPLESAGYPTELSVMREVNTMNTSLILCNAVIIFYTKPSASAGRISGS